MTKAGENSTSEDLKAALLQLPLRTAHGKTVEDPLPERLRGLLDALKGSSAIR